MQGRNAFVDGLEEGLIAVILGLMTALTFANVIARYLLDTGILWALEVSVFMFGWLVLLGAAHAVRIGAHLGVDAVLLRLSPTGRRRIGLFAAACCIVYAFLMLKGAWDYWANFAGLPATEGRWLPLGFEDNFRDKTWYETENTPMPDLFGWRPLQWMETAFNQGEPYEKIPRMIPYLVLPLAMALLLYRFIEAGIRMAQGRADSLIASHKAEQSIDAAANRRKEC